MRAVQGVDLYGFAQLPQMVQRKFTLRSIGLSHLQHYAVDCPRPKCEPENAQCHLEEFS